MELLNEKQTAELLGLKPNTLQDWRVEGKGPPYRKIGRLVRYDRSQVEQWSADQTVDPARKHGSWKPPLPHTSPVHPFLPPGKGKSRFGGHKTAAQRRDEKQAAAEALARQQKQDGSVN